MGKNKKTIQRNDTDERTTGLRFFLLFKQGRKKIKPIKWSPETIHKNGAAPKSHTSRKTNIRKMKTFVKGSIFSSLFFLFMSFSWANDNLQKAYDSSITYSTTADSLDDVIITYEKSDVRNLNYLGEVEVTERYLFFNNNGLKSKTIAELKKQTSGKGGNVVFVNIHGRKGFGFFFSSTIIGYIYKK